MNHHRDNLGIFQAEWDERATRMLYKTYDHVVWSHKLPLKPVLLQLSDSTAYWGNWNPLTRSIQIARKLIQLYSWAFVEGILRHEMAHQLASEVLKQEGSHGTAFQQACELAGVPAEFRSASVDLQATELDWRKQNEEDESNRLLTKVHKLLALATSSNEHEALAAMNKVRELYAKYNLESLESPQKQPILQLSICFRKKRVEAYQQLIVTLLIKHFFVKAIFFDEFDPVTFLPQKSVRLFGTKENVLMAEYVYFFLTQQMESMLTNLKKERSFTRVQAKSYRLGILNGFDEKLSQATPIQTEAVSNPTSSKALVALNRAIERQIEDHLETVCPRIRTTRNSGQVIDPSAYRTGQSHGAKINLHRGVTTQAKASGRLLGKP